MPNGRTPLHAKRIISHRKWVIALSYQKDHHVMPYGTRPLHIKRIITLSYKMSHYPVIPKVLYPVMPNGSLVIQNGSLSCHTKRVIMSCQMGQDHCMPKGSLVIQNGSLSYHTKRVIMSCQMGQDHCIPKGSSHCHTK